ncbi:PepSY domain-containing protein [Hydrogenophilus thiooxidans]|uniref:PepSY domain-containing protein n=1 Tax=Hydrogenophilus thiooxidans TaxID=2820326 RepID=UPI001C23EEDA|nr:PepSY domain-containing protein [Hydrogenophilus thiooxidans]
MKRRVTARAKRAHGVRYSLVGIAVACACLTVLPFGHADERKLRHEELFDAVRVGKIVPLESLLAQLRATLPGELIESELERKAWSPSGWVYEVKWLTHDGRLLKRYYDAQTGQLLREKTE